MLSLEDVEAARDRVAETARDTPLEYSYTFSSMTGAEVHLKFENLQRTGAFKIRGATNRIATLSELCERSYEVEGPCRDRKEGSFLSR